MSRSRWIKRVLAGALAFSASGGCKQPLFTDPADYVDAVKVPLPKELLNHPHGPIIAGPVDRMNDPTTVTDFVRPPRHTTLRECIAIALEQGNVGSQNQQQFGLKNEQFGLFNGRGVGGTDAIRAFAVDPAVASAEIERSLSRFDTRWVNVMQWQKLDQPVAAQFLAFQQSRDTALFSSTLAKPLPTGGVAGITFSTDYSKFSRQAAQQTALINPNYTPRVQFTYEQPLLRLFGVEINQIAGITPLSEGSQFLGGIRPAGGVGTEGILITRIRLDQAKADFETRVNYMLMNVEAAYWNLFAAYFNLYAQEEGLRQAFEGYRFIRIRVEFGQDPPQRLEQIQAQFHRFQGQVVQARGQVLESERQLRGLLNLRSDDGMRIVPIDEPNLAPYKPDFHEAANDTIALRPELMLARQEVKFRQLDLVLQKNLRRPDLRTYMSYDFAGLGTRLDGATDIDGPGNVVNPGNAFGSLSDNRFNSWTLGFRLDVPLGFRDANGLVRQANLGLTRSYVQLRDAELKAIEYLAFQYRRVIETHALIAPREAERRMLQQFVYRIRERIRIGAYSPDEFLNLLTVQQQLAVAIAAESQAVANYNIALASFEFAKGTIQQYNNVSIGEGALPPWVSKRAADHIRERTEAAIKLREQALPPGVAPVGGHPIGPPGGVNSVLHLPPFAEKREPLPEMLPPHDPMLDKNPMDPNAAPEPRPLPGMNPASWLQPAPAPVAGPTGTTDGTFKPNGTIKVPSVPPGTRPPLIGNPQPTGNGPGTPGEFFRPGERVVLPPLPKGTTPGVIGSTPPLGGIGGNPGDFFKPDGRVTLPKKDLPSWSTPTTPVPAPAPTPAPAPLPPSVDVVPPLPVVPPSLPPMAGTN